jgi:hypothetical protein
LRSPDTEKIAATAYSYPGVGYSVAANERIFALQLVVSAGSSIEAGGALPGCGTSVCIVVDQCLPGSISNSAVTLLSSPSLLGNQVTFNNGQYAQCLAVPAIRHTWGQLKTLYR